MSLRPSVLRVRHSIAPAAALRRFCALSVLALYLLLTAAPGVDAAPAAASVEANRSEAGTTARKRSARLVPAPRAAQPRPATGLVPDLAGESRQALVAALHRSAPKLSAAVLERAVDAAACAVSQGVTLERPLLSVIDYSLPSTKPRLWVFDLARRQLLYREIVAHGVGSGDNYARTFSNTPESRQSSLGLFRTADTYYGKNGYSLRLDGLEPGINDLAYERTIVVHGADYVSTEFAARHGRLGRSWGCPALRREVARSVIDTVKEGTLLFIDHPQGGWLDGSTYLNACTPGSAPVRTAAVAAR
jgi:hypothetical protein